MEKISLVKQKALNSLNPVMKIGDQIMLPFIYHLSYSKKDARKNTMALLDLVKIEHLYFDSYPHELSGGMRQRISIARAFAIAPKILYADEAFTALDELTASRIRKDLLGLIKETEITTLFITHSVPEAVEIAERILVFSRPGRVILEINCKAEKAKNNPVNKIEGLVRDGLSLAREDMLRAGTAEDVTAEDLKIKNEV